MSVGKIMANGRLLDTNVLVRAMNNQLRLPSWADTDTNVFIPITVYGELIFGAEKSARVMYNKMRVKIACSKFILLNTTEEVGNAYGKLKSDLQKIGKLIPENDIWIAATALAFDLIIVTGDKHFERVPNLQVEYI